MEFCRSGFRRLGVIHLNSPCRNARVQLNTLWKAILQEDCSGADARQSAHNNRPGSPRYSLAKSNTNGTSQLRCLAPRSQVVFEYRPLER